MEGCLELGNVTTCCNGLQWLMGWSRHVMLLQNTECVHTTTLQNNLFFVSCPVWRQNERDHVSNVTTFHAVLSTHISEHEKCAC